MTQNEYLTKIKEKLNENPVIGLKTLMNELSCSNNIVYDSISKLSKNGDKNACVWEETAHIRNKWKHWRYTLQLIAYAIKHGLTTEDIKKMPIMSSVDRYSENGSVLSVLEPRTIASRKRDETLPNVKKSAIELMKIFGKYDITNQKIEYVLRAYRISV